MSSSTHREACQSILSQLFGEGNFEHDVDLGVSSPYCQISPGVNGARMISKSKVKFYHSLCLEYSGIWLHPLVFALVLIVINVTFQTFYFMLLFPVYAVPSCPSLWLSFTITSQHSIKQVNKLFAFCSYEVKHLLKIIETLWSKLLCFLLFSYLTCSQHFFHLSGDITQIVPAIIRYLCSMCS